MRLLMSRRVALFDLVLLLQIPPWHFIPVHICVHKLARKCEWVSERESGAVLCLRFAETGRGFADKRKGHVTAQRDYHKERQAEGGGGGRGTKDLPGLSLHTSPLSFHWLMAHKWKQTVKKMKISGPSALPLREHGYIQLTHRASVMCASHSAGETHTGPPTYSYCNNNQN